MMTRFDLRKAQLRGPDHFPRFRTREPGTLLLASRLGAEEIILVFERGGLSRALLVSQMAFHHVAQGTLAGEPYVVAF